jgi:hypothetical protein
MVVSELLLGKHTPAEMNMHATIDFLLEMGCFLCGLHQRVVKKRIGATSQAVQGRLRRDGAIVELIVDKSSAWVAVTRI